MCSFRSSHVYFFGDFNYRIDLPDTEVRSHITSGDWASLFVRDQVCFLFNSISDYFTNLCVQLRVQMEERHVFEGFREAPLVFAPTYKYDRMSTGYDSSDK